MRDDLDWNCCTFVLFDGSKTFFYMILSQGLCDAVFVDVCCLLFSVWTVQFSAPFVVEVWFLEALSYCHTVTNNTVLAVHNPPNETLLLFLHLNLVKKNYIDALLINISDMIAGKNLFENYWLVIFFLICNLLDILIHWCINILLINYKFD